MKVSIFPENGEWLLVLNHTEQSHDPAEVDMTHTASSFDNAKFGRDTVALVLVWGLSPIPD